jgi:peroxiredoxin
MKKLITILLLCFGVQAMSQNEAPKGLKVGDTAPEFVVTDYAGKKIMLSEMLKKGKVVMTFYRGAWCPYCNKYMSELQTNVAKFAEKGVSVIAVTPETNEFVKEMVDKTKASFSVVYDENRTIMTDYKVLYELNDELKGKFKTYGIDLNKRNGFNDNVLPVPATYVIGQNGKIEFVHFDPNYSVRAKMEDIMGSL